MFRKYREMASSRNWSLLPPYGFLVSTGGFVACLTWLFVERGDIAALVAVLVMVALALILEFIFAR